LSKVWVNTHKSSVYSCVYCHSMSTWKLHWWDLSVSPWMGGTKLWTR